jgi:cation:H+ antiporter
MLLAVLGVVSGLAILTAAADWFVVGAVRLAARLRLSAVVIGAVVIGFGTSAPEMVVSGLAAGQGKLDIAVGNIVGSNIANLSLVLGAAALVTTLTVTGRTIRREVPLVLGATVVFAVVVQDGLSRAEGLLLLVGVVASVGWVLVSSRGGGDEELTHEVEEFLADGPVVLSREVVRTLVGLVGTLGAAQLLVVNATSVAERLGLAEGFVGLTIVAIGTSLPELATALQAARKDETDLIVGNLLGSNLFNSLAVGGVAALAGPGPVGDPVLTGTAIWLMLGIAVTAKLFMRTGYRVVRPEGGILLAVWLGSLPLLA